MKAFSITQIYFTEETKKEVSPFCVPYYNERRGRLHDALFENAIIASHRITEPALFHGVWSWQAVRKLKLAGNEGFCFERLGEVCRWLHADGVQVVAFHHNNENRRIFHNTEGAYLGQLFNTLMEHLGWGVRYGGKGAGVMQNHWLANEDVFIDYQKWLNKAIDFMQTPEMEAMLCRKSTYKGYPYYTFVLELLMSAYITETSPNWAYYKKYGNTANSLSRGE